MEGRLFNVNTSQSRRRPQFESTSVDPLFPYTVVGRRVEADAGRPGLWTSYHSRSLSDLKEEGRIRGGSGLRERGTWLWTFTGSKSLNPTSRMCQGRGLEKGEVTKDGDLFRSGRQVHGFGL